MGDDRVTWQEIEAFVQRLRRDRRQFVAGSEIWSDFNNACDRLDVLGSQLEMMGRDPAYAELMSVRPDAGASAGEK